MPKVYDFFRSGGNSTSFSGQHEVCEEEGRQLLISGRSHYQISSRSVRYTCMITVHCRPKPHESNVVASEACQWDFSQELSTSCGTQAARGRVIMPKVYDFFRSASSSTNFTGQHDVRAKERRELLLSGRSQYQMLSRRVRYTCMITVHCRP